MSALPTRSVLERPVARHAGVHLIACLLLLLHAASALAQSLTFPELSGRIVDGANILSAEARSRLDQKLAAHETKTSDQIVIATVPSLQGTSIDDYANQLFRHWKLGQAKTNNGVLLLVAPNERKVRIEVGYGLEGSLTDAVSSMIIRAAVAPKFKQNDFAGGLDAAADAIVSTLEGGTEWQDRAKMRNPSQADAGYDPIAILFVIIMIVIVVNIMASRARQSTAGRGRAHRRSDGGWIVIPSSGGWSGGGGSWGGGFGGGGGGFSGGGGSSGGGGASGDW